MRAKRRFREYARDERYCYLAGDRVRRGFAGEVHRADGARAHDTVGEKLLGALKRDQRIIGFASY